ncbi:MAG: ABC transporter substrate-binding protein [Chloroflexi bacterium]|nr:ABC transporter substrate-binding protein [Chloroflexota bacterium]
MTRAWPRLCLILLPLLACAPPPASVPAGNVVAAEQRAESQVIRIAFSFIYASLSPEIASGFGNLAAPLYDQLTRFGPNYQVQPAIAEQWDLSADGLSWRFTIRSDMRWPDGSLLSAEDVAFTLQTALEKNWPVRTYYTTVSQVSAPDRRTVVIMTRTLDVSIPNAGAYLWVVPKAYFEQVGAEGFRQKPMGSGPYEVVEFVSGQRIHYKKRNQPHAYRTPANDELIFTAIVEASQKIYGIRTGELDFSHLLLNAEQIDTAQRAGLQLKRLENDTSIAILIPFGTAQTKGTPLQDKRVRQALNYAVDKETVTRVALRGSHEPSGQLGLPSSQFWDPTIPVWPYDPAKAKQLLAEAGYATGFKMTIDFTPAAMAREIPLAIQDGLREVGIELEIRTHEPTAFVDLAQGRGNQVRGDLFATTFSETTGFFTGARNLLGCNRPQPNNPAVIFYCNPEWDRLFDQALQERDPTRRAALYRQLVGLTREDVIALFFATRSSYVVQSPKLRGFEAPVPNASGFTLDSVYKVR